MPCPFPGGLPPRDPPLYSQGLPPPRPPPHSPGSPAACRPADPPLYSVELRLPHHDTDTPTFEVFAGQRQGPPSHPEGPRKPLQQPRIDARRTPNRWISHQSRKCIQTYTGGGEPPEGPPGALPTSSKIAHGDAAHFMPSTLCNFA